MVSSIPDICRDVIRARARFLRMLSLWRARTKSTKKRIARCLEVSVVSEECASFGDKTVWRLSAGRQFDRGTAVCASPHEIRRHSPSLPLSRAVDDDFSRVEITRRGDARERDRERGRGAAASRKKGYRCLLAAVAAGRAGPGADERAARAGTSCCYLYQIRGHTGSVAEAERARSLVRARPREPGRRAVYQKATAKRGGEGG